MTSTAPKTQTGTYYYQKKGLYSVVIFETEDNYDIYFLKDGRYVMQFAFGLPKWQDTLESSFEIGWANLDDYKEDMFGEED